MFIEVCWATYWVYASASDIRGAISQLRWCALRKKAGYFFVSHYRTIRISFLVFQPLNDALAASASRESGE